MKNFGNILWGIVLIVIGLIFAGNAFGITDINIFFKGWWTLFIIVPCFIGLFKEREKTGNIIGLIIGVLLLLCNQNILNFQTLWKLIIPIILVAVGLSIIFKDVFNQKVNSEIKKLNDKMNSGENEYCATFSGQNVSFAGEEFKGASLTAVFGGVKCDLMNSIINEDRVINCFAIFGGIDLYVPKDVKVKIKSTSIFGGVSDKNVYTNSESAKTIYVNATCIFGGVDIK